MNETIQDGVAEGWVADNVVPMFDGDWLVTMVVSIRASSLVE